MPDNDWKDLVSVLPIKKKHLSGASIESTAYSTKLQNTNSKCFLRAVCISPMPSLFFFYLHIKYMLSHVRAHELCP